MKYIFLILAFILGMRGYSQVYNPSLHTVTNKAMGFSQATPGDARSQYYDATNFVYRDYASKTEVMTYLNLAKYRQGHFPVYIHQGGTLTGGGIWIGGSTDIYVFKDSTDINSLVYWNTVQSVNGRTGVVVIGNADSIRNKVVDFSTVYRNNYLLAIDTALNKIFLTPPPSGYIQGTGIDITGSVISALNNSPLWNANQLRGRSITTGTPNVGQTLSYNGTTWIYSSLNGLDTAYLSNDTLYLVNTFDTIPVNLSPLTTTASNGLTKDGQDIKLGGTLTENTNINAGDNNLFFEAANANVGITAGNGNSNIIVTPTTFEAMTGANTSVKRIRADESGNEGIVVSDGVDSIGFVGANLSTPKILSNDTAYTRVREVKRLISDSIATAGNANNGLSKSGSNIVLGQDFLDPTNPAALTGYREIPMGSNAIFYTSPNATTSQTANSYSIAGDSTNGFAAGIGLVNAGSPNALTLQGNPNYGKIGFGSNSVESIKLLPDTTVALMNVKTGLSTDSVLVKGTDGVVRKVAQNSIIPSLTAERIPFGGVTNIQTSTSNLTYDSTNKSLIINKGSSDSVAIKIKQNYTANYQKPFFSLEPGFKNDSTMNYEMVSQIVTNDDNTRSNHVILSGFNINGTYPNLFRWYGRRESNWYTGGLRHIEWCASEAQYPASLGSANIRTYFIDMVPRTSPATASISHQFIGTDMSMALPTGTGFLGITPGTLSLGNGGTSNARLQFYNGSETAEIKNESGIVTMSTTNSIPWNIQGNLALRTTCSGSTERAALRLFNNSGQDAGIFFYSTAYATSKYRSGLTINNNSGAFTQSIWIDNSNHIMVGDNVAYSVGAQAVQLMGSTRIFGHTRADSTVLINRTTVGPYGLDVNRSVAINKDSATIVGSITNQSIALIDTTTGQIKRIAASALAGTTIYNGDGTLSSNRTVTMSGNTLNFTGGNTGFGVTSPTAVVHLKAGTATASTAPLKFTSGTNLTTAEAGTHEYNGSHYETKASGLRYATGGVIADFYTDVNNSGTGETDIYSYTTPASTLANDGEKLTFSYALNLNDVTASSQLKVYFAGVAIANTGAITIGNTGVARITGWIIRTGSTTARASVTVATGVGSSTISTSENDLTSLTFTNTNILKVTAQAGGAGGGSNDITGKIGTVSWWGTANN